MKLVKVTFYGDVPGLGPGNVIKWFQGWAVHVAPWIGDAELLEVTSPKAKIVPSNYHGDRPHITVARWVSKKQYNEGIKIAKSLNGTDYNEAKLRYLGYRRYLGCLLTPLRRIWCKPDKIICVDAVTKVCEVYGEQYPRDINVVPLMFAMLQNGWQTYQSNGAVSPSVLRKLDGT